MAQSEWEIRVGDDHLPMCGRYKLSRRKEILAEHFDVDWDDLDWQPRYPTSSGLSGKDGYVSDVAGTNTLLPNHESASR